MPKKMDIDQLKAKAKLKNRYSKQLKRLKEKGIGTACIEEAVTQTLSKIGPSGMTSMVIYGDPQSGKTEMMICLTAKLLDEEHPVIVHLLNDSVDLLSQNLGRFKQSGLAPAARVSSEIPSKAELPHEVVLLCKKNTKDLEKLIQLLAKKKNIIVIDDEADYATPNSKINQGTKSAINKWIGQIVAGKGHYIGVTATPARLNLNKTLQNDVKQWVKFPPHSAYTGQDTFFPLNAESLPYRLKFLTQGGNAEEAKDAVVRFLVTVAFLNTSGEEDNYTMLVHTSGKRDDHEADRVTIEKTVEILLDPENPKFETLVQKVYKAALELYPQADPQKLAEYVVENASKTTLVVLNSRRDRKAAGSNAAEPTSPFTIVIGGNIVSRGVTFPNLLAMFFTRNVQHRLQQDTYIQRARMFGARSKYLEHFELTIPAQLYGDWHRCFVYHKLSLDTISNGLGVPVWIGDGRVSVASSSSIDKSTVTRDKGEMSYAMFDYMESLEEVIKAAPTDPSTLKKLQAVVGKQALPDFLIRFIEAAQETSPGSLAIHESSSIQNYGPSANKAKIARSKGFMGVPQLESNKFPKAIHHVKIFRNGAGKARVFYKVSGGVQFIKSKQSNFTGAI